MNGDECKILGVWSFSPESIKTMRKLNDKARDAGLEYGSNIVADIHTRLLYLHGECTGSECNIGEMGKLEKRIPEDKILAGEFHTHPKAKRFGASTGDLLRFESIGIVNCIGTPNAKENEQLMCMKHKYKALEPERIKKRRELLTRQYKTGLITHHPKLFKKDFDIVDPRKCINYTGMS